MSFSEVIPLLEKFLKFPLFPVKDTIITIASLLALVAFMVGFIILARVLNHVLRTKILAKTRLDEGLGQPELKTAIILPELQRKHLS